MRRAKWSADSLRNAIVCVQNRTMGVNEAARQFGIPKTTLKDRIKKGDVIKHHILGPSSALGEEAELKLVRHIKKLQTFGFAPDQETVRIWTFQLAEELKLKHTFNKAKGRAGYGYKARIL
ncbi:CENP-B N-terminal DNA-binding domain [Popillia japonica]|uniref:CENP-B N-terminal DNA-binding domain n=1 Tax=Popillia japonica TaxID=7064 RepID=A0AAW1JGS6_POPJA